MRKVITLLILSALILMVGCETANTNSDSSTASIKTSAVSKTTQVSSVAQSKPLPKTEEEAVTYIVENIKNKHYDDAWYNTYNIFKSAEVVTLGNYAFALKKNNETDFEARNLWIETQLSPDYKGQLADEMKAFCLKYADIVYNKYADLKDGEWVAKNEYKINEEKVKALNEVDTRKYPAIGMTGSEVRASIWGGPDNINKTTTANGVSEQWVYKVGDYDMKFIYLDDGIVTAIQN